MRPMPHTLKGWLRSWSWGQASAAEVIRSAHRHVQDVGRQADARITRLAKTFYSIQNAERAVENVVPTEELPQTISIADSQIDCVLPPFECFRWLKETCPRRFQAHLGAKPEGVADWWVAFKSSMAGRRMWRLHPWLRGKEPQDLRWHLPLMIFDDAGPVSNISSTFVRCWYSVLGAGSERETRFLMSTGLKDAAGPDRSWGPIMQSFEDLAKPVAPGDWGGLLLFIGADLEYMCNIIGIPHFNSPYACCCLCEANMDMDDKPFNDFSPGAAWRGTEVHNVRFMERLRQPLHPLCSHPWFNMHTFRFDMLHLLDHHGLASHVVGNVLWTHLSGDRDCEVFPGANIDHRVDFLNTDLAAWYSQTGTRNRLPVLKESNVKEGPFPELKGHGVKAANTRAVVPYILDVQRRACRQQPSRRNRHMLKVVESLDGFYQICYNGSYFLPREEIASMQAHVARFAQHYQFLATTAVANEHTMWKMTVKIHYVCAHLPQQAELINPRFTQGYSSESMVGEIAGVYGASQSGPFHTVVQTTALLKYRTGLLLLWE